MNVSACDLVDNAWLRSHPRPLLFLVEGHHDVEFLRRLTGKLHLGDPKIPPLAALEQAGRIIFIPIGGGNVLAWSFRFAPLGCAEFHLYDREIAPETDLRLQAIQAINARRYCRGYLTLKRSLENYLHPKAIVEAGGTSFEFGDNDCVAELAARTKFPGTDSDWRNLSSRSRARFANRIKKWLSSVAVESMSLNLLWECDPLGEILGWLREISQLLESCGSV